jgi:pimeloyl-ACP methyl ester carboxylesterase
MGGAIATSFLYKSPLAERVRAVIFDAPLLDFGAAVDWGVRNVVVPGIVITTGKIIAESRFDFDFDELNYLKRADELTVPILLFHGDDDPTAPVTTSDALAEARPDIVTYVRVADAGHVRSWNAGPAAYEASVREFLERVAP